DARTTVAVKTVAPTITPGRMEVSNVKATERIRVLPLNSRSISSLFVLTPGVDAGPDASTGSPRVNGMKVGSLGITVDGLSSVDRFGGGIARVQPGLDTVEEFR